MAAAESADRILDHLEAESSPEPDVVLLATRARLHLALVDQSHEEPARFLADRLATMTARPGITGWGLSYDWDAFGDGTTNPSRTVYSYTTAAAALAYIDAYEVLGDRRYLDLAIAAEETLLSATCCWDDGELASVWYSDQPADQHPNLRVHNVSGLSLAVIARLDQIEGRTESAIRTKLANFLVNEQGGQWDRPEHAHPSNWPYGVTRHRASDLIHETFIIEGLAWHSGASDPVTDALKGIAQTHFDASGIPAPDVHTMGSLGWGPPAGLYILVGSTSFSELTDEIAAYLSKSINDKGMTELVPTNNARALAWYALGLARYSANRAGETQLEPWSSVD